MSGSFPPTLKEQKPRTAVPTRRQPALLFVEEPFVKILLTFQATVPPYTLTYGEKRGSMQEQLAIPAGTQLIGICSQDEPAEGCYHLLGDDYAWAVPRQDVTVAVLDADYPVLHAQTSLAQEHIQQAQQCFQREDYQEAQRLYASAEVSLIACNASFRIVGQTQMERVIALIKAQAESKLITEQLEQAASTYEKALEEWGLRFSGEHITVAEEASQVQVFLVQQYAYAGESQKARRSVERLLALNKLIKKRYQVKVALLLHAAEILLQLGDSAQAARVVADADRFFQQQLVTLASYDDDVAKLGQRLGRLKSRGNVSIHDIAFTITADTRDDLETILSAFKGAQLDGLVIPKTMSRVPKGNSARHGYMYCFDTAKLRLKCSADREE